MQLFSCYLKMGNAQTAFSEACGRARYLRTSVNKTARTRTPARRFVGDARDGPLQLDLNSGRDEKHLRRS